MQAIGSHCVPVARPSSVFLDPMWSHQEAVINLPSAGRSGNFLEFPAGRQTRASATIRGGREAEALKHPSLHRRQFRDHLLRLAIANLQDVALHRFKQLDEAVRRRTRAGPPFRVKWQRLDAGRPPIKIIGGNSGGSGNSWVRRSTGSSSLTSSLTGLFGRRWPVTSDESRGLRR